MLHIFAFFCPLGIAKPSVLTFVHVLPTLLIDACENVSAVEAPTKNREKSAGLGGENPRPSDVSAFAARGGATRPVDPPPHPVPGSAFPGGRPR